ncbi:hypothetical protein [Porphyromonas sp.]|uniref:hypothetical protein n=1 Tax=Porphyromonas sp. TaxID=1924944 RepID=UPI0026DB04E3|nr:hypothetical protein [Porphyromonas sp.]MDO4770829.1 hypothetical protein [Porphyromonas sp.]
MNRFKNSFSEADLAFSRQSSRALRQLKGLSAAELAQILPKTTDEEVYKKLIEVVEEAARKNIKQAELITKIKDLGDLAIKLAQKVPALACLF